MINTITQKRRRPGATRQPQTSHDLKQDLLDLQMAVTQQELEEMKSGVADFKSLGQIDRAYKQTRFDSYLRVATRSLRDYLQSVQREETPEYWKARVLLYELNEIFNLSNTINQTTANEGQRILEELRVLSARWVRDTSLTITDRRVLKEKVLFCACWGNELKRQGDTTLAQSVFEWLLDFTTNRLLTDGFNCYGTRATLSYLIGSALRTLEQHRRAEVMYSQALNLLYERAKRREKENDQAFLIRKQAMVVGLGFGWMNITRGFLARAEHALTTARSMLACTGDELVSSYVELLCGSVKRCRAGTNKESLKEAIDQLQRTRRAFADHPRYKARACWELALAKTLVGDFNGAQEDLRAVARYAEETSNQKWRVNVLILQSRIQRKQGRYKEALALSETALDKAKSPDCKSVLPMVDAYITRGEAHLSMAQESTAPDSQYAIARADFERALQCALMRKGTNGKVDYFSNPKIAGVCSLRVAQCYARARNQASAKKHFSMWLRLAPHVEHEWVRELADRVKAEIDRLSMDFTISAFDNCEWSYAKNVARLRQWLLTQALRQTNKNYSEAARLIGVQRATLYQWQAHKESAKQHRVRTSEGQAN